MEGKQAKALVSVAEGRMEFEGSEEFVEKQLTIFADLIKQSLQRAPAAKKPPGGRDDTKAENDRGKTIDLSGYENVFAEADGKIQILKNLPGSSTAEKMANAARLLALGNTLVGKQTTTFQEIRDLCKAHGCLDGANFSSTIKGAKSDFVLGGGPRSQTLSLTKPGRTTAEKLAAELNK
jgi:hypothetical protein